MMTISSLDRATQSSIVHLPSSRSPLCVQLQSLLLLAAISCTSHLLISPAAAAYHQHLPHNLTEDAALLKAARELLAEANASGDDYEGEINSSSKEGNADGLHANNPEVIFDFPEFPSNRIDVDENGNNISDEEDMSSQQRLKRAPSGFMGMRGKLWT